MGDPVPQPDLLQRVHGPVATLRPACTGIAQRQFDVAPRGQCRKQVELLEDKADAPIADLGQLLLGHPADVLAGKVVATRGGHIETSEDVHQG